VLAPDGTLGDTRQLFYAQVDNAMVKAVVRAFRWREKLESGGSATIRELADAETINVSYVSRVLRLTLLAPDIIESIIGGRQPENITLAALMRRLPPTWIDQRSKLTNPPR
jgi:DNA-binding IscR family transcriptional regulator